jgi:hypothetical protein
MEKVETPVILIVEECVHIAAESASRISEDSDTKLSGGGAK